MLRNRALAYFALLAAVFIWGVNFVVVKEATKAWRGQEFTFLAARFWLACLVFGSFLIFRNRSITKAFAIGRSQLLQTALVGGVLAVGYAFQTWYLAQESSGAVSAAFLTSTTVLWAPLLARLFRQKVYRATVVGAVVAMVGIVCIEWQSATWKSGWANWLALLAAIAFAVEILLVSRFAPKDQSIQWTTVCCFCVAIIMSVTAASREGWSWPEGQGTPRVFAVVFTGLFATAVALGLQNWAQAQEIDEVKIVDGPRAAIIGTLEPVFTTLAVGALILLGLQGRYPDDPTLPAVGCFLILAGTLVSEFAAAKRGQREAAADAARDDGARQPRWVAPSGALQAAEEFQDIAK
jgi:drug/metabolite transporter (DMT)-like permease